MWRDLGGHTSIIQKRGQNLEHWRYSYVWIVTWKCQGQWLEDANDQ